MRNKKGSKLRLKSYLKGALGLILIPACIFISAGRVGYWQGWAYVGTIILIGVVMITIFIRGKKLELLQERTNPGPGTKWWDKVFFAFYAPSYLAILIVGSLDSGRYFWTSDFAVSIYIIGYAVFLFAIAIFLWSMWVNRFFSSTVRIQSDRGQFVIQSGPYRFVRHPGYVAGILLALGNSLVFGSFWALIPAGLMALSLVIRTGLEDVTLKKELPGYVEYTRKTKYRLFPGLW
jgi:protein-S-isoprenylcysteine O-methyltransferase Ste14